MIVETKFFGELEVDDDKIITFENGIPGFEEYSKYTIIFDSETDVKSISWLQSIENKEIALPIVNPFLFVPDYSPDIDDSYLSLLGEIQEEDLLVFAIAVIREDVFTINLKAPVVINAKTLLAAQMVVENNDYSVKYDIRATLRSDEHLETVGD